MMLISWNVTKKCNLKCRHCYRDAGVEGEGELSYEEGIALIQEIASAGFETLILSGGEPLIREDIYDLIAKAKEIGLSPVLGTNGSLITQEVAKKLKEVGIRRVGVSLDSVNREKHDSFRRSSGAFERTLAGISYLKEVGVMFQIHTTVMDFNYEEMEEISDFSSRLGAASHHIFFLIPTGRASLQSTPLVNYKEIERFKVLLNRILLKRKASKIEIKPTCAPQFIRMVQGEVGFKRGCLAGLTYCCILPNGDIHPCPYLPLKVGNVRSDGFQRFWSGKEGVLANLRTMLYKDKCGRCDFREVCGGCRAKAYHYGGDYMGEDPFCFF
jgi:putative heme d1 biosynthesis radical SAM protein NirJ2